MQPWSGDGDCYDVLREGSDAMRNNLSIDRILSIQFHQGKISWTFKMRALLQIIATNHTSYTCESMNGKPSLFDFDFALVLIMLSDKPAKARMHTRWLFTSILPHSLIILCDRLYGKSSLFDFYFALVLTIVNSAIDLYNYERYITMSYTFKQQ